MLAFCYEYGLGAEVDLDKARDMFKQAGQSEKKIMVTRLQM